MQIETARLRLRPFTPQDLAEMTALLADPGFMAWSVGGPVGAAAARRKLEGDIASFETRGFSKLAISLRDIRLHGRAWRLYRLRRPD